MDTYKFYIQVETFRAQIVNYLITCLYSVSETRSIEFFIPTKCMTPTLQDKSSFNLELSVRCKDCGLRIRTCVLGVFKTINVVIKFNKKRYKPSDTGKGYNHYN